MNASLNTALSGLMANAAKLGVSASNVANAQTPGYKAQVAEMEWVAGGGVKAKVTESQAPSTTIYAPEASGADENGMASLPNVSFEEEAVNQKMAEIGYTANAQVVKTLEAMDKSLFDIKV